MFINAHTHHEVCQTSSTIVVARTPLGLLSCLNKKYIYKKSQRHKTLCLSVHSRRAEAGGRELGFKFDKELTVRMLSTYS
jgi:hypothetical protein